MNRVMDNPITFQISVIVCTHNRAATLARTLQSLVLQNLDPSQYEIIVVDNASTDDTRTMVRELTTRVPNLRYAPEPRLGLSHARNTGIKRASGGIIAFLDDDAEAERDWLHELLLTFHHVKPLPSCVGGKVTPTWEAMKPEWLPDCLVSYLGVIDWGDIPHWISLPKEYVAGVNMAFLKSDLVDQGGFNPSLGRIGDSLLSNEEILLLYNLQKEGKGIYYQPKACVRHLVSESRLTRSYFLRRAYWQGISDSVVNHVLGRSSAGNRLGKLKWRLQTSVGNGLRSLWTRDRREQVRYLAESAYSLGAGVQESRFILDPSRLEKTWSVLGSH